MSIQSRGVWLPLPRREQLDDAGRRTYDSLADPQVGTIRGLRGPGGAIQLQNAELFGRFFERLPTGGDARNKRLARLAL